MTWFFHVVQLYILSYLKEPVGVSVRPSHVERDSVNSVALCDDQSLAASAASAAGQCSSRMMVASSVYLNPTSTAYSARDTTIMPNIQALLAIVAITFAPNIELRCPQLLHHEHFCLSRKSLKVDIRFDIACVSYGAILSWGHEVINKVLRLVNLDPVLSVRLSA